ncbi:MAG: heparinase II/III family protein [Clostridia bacterium]|nr:heparinase II/III family protein [Clostridia bacterium]
MRRFLSHKRKYLPLFIGLLIIGVLIGIMVPFAGSADSGGFGPTNITRETFTSSSSGTYVKKANIRSSLLSNGKHFYPHSSNDNKGNDLLIEFSLLWNESMKNLKDGSIAIGRIGNNNGGDAANAFYFNCGDNLPGEWSPYAGSFECGAFRTVEYGPEGTVQQNAAADQYPYIGEYGWHRIGVRIHEDAWINGSTVRYRITVTLYVDGVTASILSGHPGNENNLLYTASIVNGQLQYTDIPTDRVVYGFRLASKQTKPNTVADFIYADYTVSCGRAFVQDVEPEFDPDYQTLYSHPAAVYYKENETPSMILTEPTSTQPGQIVRYFAREGAMRIDPYPAAEYNAALTAARNGISACTNNQFGSTSAQNMSTSAYQDPLQNPTAGQHPRLLMNPNTLSDVRDTTFDPVHNDYLTRLINNANAHSSVSLNNGAYNDEYLNTICAKAYLYQMTGVDLYGYEAIRMIKEYIKQIGSISGGDPCRKYGEIMFNAALVYDWCNDLLNTVGSTNDKEQLIRGVQNKLCKDGKMEVGFPPSGQGAVTGHGSERQILRDYLSFALAIYDDKPSWWDYVGGRFYQEFVPVRNVFYQADNVPQGISTYVPIRFTSDLWSAWLVKIATGVFPYNSQTHMKNVLYSNYSLITNGTTRIFEGGDDEGHSGKWALEQLALAGMIGGYLFNDSTPLSWAEYIKYKDVGSVYYMILQSGSAVPNKDARYDNMELMIYNGSWLGQIVAHKSWGDDGAVLMKLGGRTTGNHDHADAGSFQIYYKGALAVDSGFYDSYNSSHRNNYHIQTIAHNSIVFYRHSGNSTTVLGQKTVGETGTLSSWLSNSDYNTGTVTGHEIAYADPHRSEPIYAYIAGDISQAYVSSAYVYRMDRRMLTVFDTEEDDVPLFFFVFDYIGSQNNNDEKTFVLHVPNEPVISSDNKSAYVDNEDGRLVMQSVYCGQGSNFGMTTLYGDDKFKVGDQNYPTLEGDDDYWGRIELKPDPNVKNKEQAMLNVFFVTPKSTGKTAASLPATHFSNSKVQGATIGNTAVAFVSQANRISTTFDMTTQGNSSDRFNYYVSGVAAGSWRIESWNGSTLANCTVSEESGLLVFNAPAGYVRMVYLGNN